MDTGWREEFPDLATAYDKSGGSESRFRRLAERRRGRPKGSKNKHDALFRRASNHYEEAPTGSDGFIDLGEGARLSVPVRYD